MNKGEGWRLFAGIVLGMSGIMRLFDAVWAFGYHGALPNNLQGAFFGHSLRAYAWIDLIVAFLLAGSAFGVLVGSQASRWIGIAAGAVLAISAIWWMPYYPIWSLVYITIGVLVIHALATYGSREAVDGP